MGNDKKNVRVGKWLDFKESISIPFVSRSTKDLCVRKNVSYGKEPREILDVLYKKDGNKKPLIIYVHGGGFISGVRKLRKYICADYARSGFVVANVDYTLAPKRRFPYQLQEIFYAIEFLIENADLYEIDVNKIAIAGESAGAYFSAYVASIVKNKELFDMLNIKFRYRDTFDVKVAVVLNGCFDFQNMLVHPLPNMPYFIDAFFGKTKEEFKSVNKEETLLYSATTYLNEKFPPCVVGRSTRDALDSESQHIINLLKKHNVPYIEFMAGGFNARHGFLIVTRTKEGKRTLKITTDYIKNVLKINQ